MRRTLSLILFFTFSLTTSAAEVLTNEEAEKLMKRAENSYLKSCLSYYEADIFVQVLVNAIIDTRVRVDGVEQESTSKLDQLRNYLNEGHLRPRAEMNIKKIPKKLKLQCENMAELAVNVMAFKTEAEANAINNALKDLVDQLQNVDPPQPAAPQTETKYKL